MKNETELLQECKLQLEYLNEKFGETGTTNALLTKIYALLPKADFNGSSFDWDKFANALKDEFGESLVEEDCGEEDAYNWWLTDVTVTDIVEFIKNYS